MPSTPLLLAAALVTTAAAQTAPAPERRALRLDFGDVQSRAEWTYPAGGAGRLPAVLLIHGSGPADLDFTLAGPDGKVLSRVFRDLADGFAARGVATLRYDKHYVSGPGQVDYAKFYGQADLNLFLKDAETALSALKADPRVDPKRLFVYGWSEGSTVAAALAAKHPELAGLIVQGPLVLPWRATFEAQFEDVQLPHLRAVVGPTLDADGLRKLVTGPGGLVARSAASYFADPQKVALGQYAVNPAFDRNGDGRLDVDTEVVPAFPAVLDFAFSPAGFFRIYAPDRALPPLTDQAAKLKMPVLVLQGEHDANTPAKYLDRLDAALKAAKLDATVKRYPGLGHSLGPAASLRDDDFAPPAPGPIDDAAAWVRAR